MVSDTVGEAAKVGGAGLAGGGAIGKVTGGLDVAQQMAGDVLRGIFGGLPWEMAADAIANAVGGGGGEAAAMIAPIVVDVVGVVA